MSLRYLFVDLNAYFASVEQQLRPELRGRPVGVAPVDAPSGCCIAVSYEAKRVGVKTGMTVAQARELCPKLVVALARPEEYVRIHHAVLAAVDKVIPVERVFSIDEFSCRLMRGEREPEQAARLAMKVKKVISQDVGEIMRCSIGVAPNRFLAKVGTDMQKPDGLTILEQKDLPARLFALKLIDLPGIGPKMDARIQGEGIHTIEQLCSLSEQQMERLWGSIIGRRWWYWLRGHDLDEFATQKRSIGHQHVLAPELRTPEAARGVAIRLLHKAAARARHLGYLPQRMSLRVGIQEPYDNRRPPEQKGWNSKHWGATVHLPGGVGDTLTLAGELGKLWESRPPGKPMFIDVTLHDLIAASAATMPLFAQERHRADLARTMDELNRKHGKHAVYLGSMHTAKETAHGGIAFSSVPDLKLTDSVTNRMR